MTSNPPPLPPKHSSLSAIVQKRADSRRPGQPSTSGEAFHTHSWSLFDGLEGNFQFDSSWELSLIRKIEATHGSSAEAPSNKNTVPTSSRKLPPPPAASSQLHFTTAQQVTYLRLIDQRYPESDIKFILDITQGDYDESLSWLRALQELRERCATSNNAATEEDMRGALLMNEGSVQKAATELSQQGGESRSNPDRVNGVTMR